MKITAAVLLLACTLAFADPPADAPVNPFPQGRSLHLSQSDLAPFAGQLIEDTEHSRREWNDERKAGELAELKKHEGQALVSVPVLVALIAGSVAVGVAVGVGATIAAQSHGSNR